MYLGPSDPLWIDDVTGAVTTWNEYTGAPTGMYGDGSLLRSGLAVRTDMTGRDPSKWSVLGWYYNGEFWNTTDEFRAAFHNGTFKYFTPDVDGDYGHTNPEGPVLQNDDLPPPVSIQPNGPRFGVDEEETYIEWSMCPLCVLPGPVWLTDLSGLFVLPFLYPRYWNETLRYQVQG